MTLNCSWEDLSSKVPSLTRTGGNGGGFSREKPPSLIHASGVSCVRSFSFRIRRVAGRQASRPLLIVLKVRRMLKRTSGLNKLMSIVHRMSMELESKFLDSVNQGRDSSEEPKCEVCK